MSDYNNGKIWGWNGGECPVHPKSEVAIWFRNGVLLSGGYAEDYWWKHSDSSADIIAFQVTKPYVEPKVIWVNEYKGGVSVFKSEDAAKKHGASYATRIAVKYVEAKDE